MIGTISGDMSGLIRMAAVGMREQHKQRRRRHGRNEGTWEINSREEHGDDGDGGGYVGQWRWQFWENHDVIDASWK